MALRAEQELTLPVAGPEEQAVTASERQAVVSAMNRLRGQDRLVLALRYFEQLTEAEMAVVMNCATGTVKSRLSRAMTRLRAELPETGVHDG